MAEKWGCVKPSLTPSAHCCQGVCTEICLAGSLRLLTPGCVILTAQLEFWWLNQRIKAHSVPATNGRLIRELYISNICIYREKLKYIQAYSPFCMTQTFSAALLDLLIFNSLIWGLVSGAHFEFMRPTFCMRENKAATLLPWKSRFQS